MPMRSQAQRAWMHIHEPAMADRWEAHTPKGKKLPKHVKKKALDTLRGYVKEARARKLVGEAIKDARPKGRNTEFLDNLANGLNLMPLPVALKVASYRDPDAHRQLVIDVISRLLGR